MPLGKFLCSTFDILKFFFFLKVFYFWDYFGHVFQFLFLHVTEHAGVAGGTPTRCSTGESTQLHLPIV